MDSGVRELQHVSHDFIQDLAVTLGTEKWLPVIAT